MWVSTERFLPIWLRLSLSELVAEAAKTPYILLSFESSAFERGQVGCKFGRLPLSISHDST